MKIYQLEVTSHCNLTCSFCARDKHWTHKEQGFMDLALLDRIDWMNTEYVELQFTGEPTLHPKLKEIISHIKSKGIMVGLSTNSTRPNVDLSEVDVVTCTIDKERSKKLDNKNGNIYLQKLGINYPYEDTTHQKPYNDVENAKKCTTPFEYVSIQWDGDVVPCCKCFGKQHVFGNLYDMTMEQIINSKKRKDFLDKMKDGSNYICTYCQIGNPHQIHEKLIEFAKESK